MESDRGQKRVLDENDDGPRSSSDAATSRARLDDALARLPPGKFERIPRPVLGEVMARTSLIVWTRWCATSPSIRTFCQWVYHEILAMQSHEVFGRYPNMDVHEQIVFGLFMNSTARVIQNACRSRVRDNTKMRHEWAKTDLALVCERLPERFWKAIFLGDMDHPPGLADTSHNPWFRERLRQLANEYTRRLFGERASPRAPPTSVKQLLEMAKDGFRGKHFVQSSLEVIRDELVMANAPFDLLGPSLLPHPDTGLFYVGLFSRSASLMYDDVEEWRRATRFQTPGRVRDWKLYLPRHDSSGPSQEPSATGGLLSPWIPMVYDSNANLLRRFGFFYSSNVPQLDRDNCGMAYPIMPLVDSRTGYFDMRGHADLYDQVYRDVMDEQPSSSSSEMMDVADLPDDLTVVVMRVNDARKVVSVQGRQFDYTDDDNLRMLFSGDAQRSVEAGVSQQKGRRTVTTYDSAVGSNTGVTLNMAHYAFEGADAVIPVSLGFDCTNGVDAGHFETELDLGRKTTRLTRNQPARLRQWDRLV